MSNGIRCNKRRGGQLSSFWHHILWNLGPYECYELCNWFLDTSLDTSLYSQIYQFWVLEWSPKQMVLRTGYNTLLAVDNRSVAKVETILTKGSLENLIGDEPQHLLFPCDLCLLRVQRGSCFHEWLPICTSWPTFKSIHPFHDWAHYLWGPWYTHLCRWYQNSCPVMYPQSPWFLSPSSSSVTNPMSTPVFVGPKFLTPPQWQVIRSNWVRTRYPAHHPGRKNGTYLTPPTIYQLFDPHLLKPPIDRHDLVAKSHFLLAKFQDLFLGRIPDLLLQSPLNPTVC